MAVRRRDRPEAPTAAIWARDHQRALRGVQRHQIAILPRRIGPSAQTSRTCGGYAWFNQAEGMYWGQLSMVPSENRRLDVADAHC